jgi:hypothetical protein
MNTVSNTFLEEITDKINKLKEFTKAEVMQDLNDMVNEIGDALNQTESPPGIPPPDDLECNYNSLSSSISVPDANIPDQLCLIKDKNRELHRTATQTLRDFKNTSRNLLSKSQLHSSKESLILNELESVRKNLTSAYEESKNFSIKNKSYSPGKSIGSEIDDSMVSVYQKIKDIQKEINEAAERLLESEKMILTTEEKNLLLENRIKKLEESVNSVIITEGPEKSKAEICTCLIF